MSGRLVVETLFNMTEETSVMLISVLTTSLRFRYGVIMLNEAAVLDFHLEKY